MILREIEVRDNGAEIYDAQYLEQRGRWPDIVERKVILDTLDTKSTDVVLDAGCGTGRIAIELSKLCKQVYATDFSGKSIAVLHQKLLMNDIRNIILSTDDISQPIPHRKFDKAVSVQVIQHVPEPMTALRNLYNCLKVGGACVVSIYNDNPFFLGSLLGRKLPKAGIFPNGIPYWRYNASELIMMFRHCGFEQVSVKGCVNVSWYARANSRVFYPVAVIDVLLSKLGLSRRLGTYLVCRGVK